MDGMLHNRSKDLLVKLAKRDFPAYSFRYKAIGRPTTKAIGVAPPTKYKEPTIAFSIPPPDPNRNPLWGVSVNIEMLSAGSPLKSITMRTTRRLPETMI